MTRIKGTVRLLLAGLFSLAGAACTLLVPDGYDPEVALSFDPVMYVANKASAATDGKYPAGVDFGVYAWDYAGTDGLRSARAWLTDARVREQGGAWQPVPAAFWPERSRQAAILAYSPYGSALSADLDGGVVFRDVDTERDQTDLLYTEPATGLSKFTGGGVVNLPFRHALSLLDFELRCNATEGESATVLGVSVDQIRVKGSFRSLPVPAWNWTEEARELSFFDGEKALGQNNIPVGDSRWIIPQSLSSGIRVRLRYTRSDSTFEEFTMESHPLNLAILDGRHYTLKLSCLLDSKTLKIDLIDDIL